MSNALQWARGGLRSAERESQMRPLAPVPPVPPVLPVPPVPLVLRVLPVPPVPPAVVTPPLLFQSGQRRLLQLQRGGRGRRRRWARGGDGAPPVGAVRGGGEGLQRPRLGAHLAARRGQDARGR